MSLRILITNNTLAGRAGTELYVRDVALALLKRGYSPIAYSSLLGEVAEELRAATVPVIDRLDALAVAPDLIHGHHHLETMTALLAFPNVPAISFCHGWLPWEEMPPKFPRISRYVAVDETCRDRLILEHAVPEKRVRLLLNFVDLKRFKSRAALPAQPKRALAFSNYASEENILPTIRAACDQFNISLDSLGVGSRNATSRPEALLPNYDLVFAKGRAALEALAVGTPVVLCDAVGAGSLVTTENMEQLRRLNFGIRALRNPMEINHLCREIGSYNATDAGQVCAWIRESAGMESAVDRLVNLYTEVLAEHRTKPPADVEEEMRATSTYLRHWVKNLTAQNEARVQYERLKIECQKQGREYAVVAKQYRELQQEHDRYKHLQAEQERLQSEKHRQQRAEHSRLQNEVHRLQDQNKQLAAERHLLQSDLAEVFSSSTLRLRNRVVGLPFVGTWLKSFARLAAGRSS
jgi:predicted  nucleic acid-binding Zn-ribbon protein